MKRLILAVLIILVIPTTLLAQQQSVGVIGGLTDGQFQTVQYIQMTAGAAINALDIVVIYNDAGSAKVQPADNTDTDPILGVATATVSSGAAVVIYTGPMLFIRDDTFGTDANSAAMQLYASATAGVPQIIADSSIPQTAGNIVAPVGVCVGADGQGGVTGDYFLMFRPQRKVVIGE